MGARQQNPENAPIGRVRNDSFTQFQDNFYNFFNNLVKNMKVATQVSPRAQTSIFSWS
jgi:hypothetical protein